MDKTSKHDQIPINFAFCNEKTLENYIAGGNQQLVDALKLFASENLGQLIYVYGKSQPESRISVKQSLTLSLVTKFMLISPILSY